MTQIIALHVAVTLGLGAPPALHSPVEIGLLRHDGERGVAWVDLASDYIVTVPVVHPPKVILWDINTLERRAELVLSRRELSVVCTAVAGDRLLLGTWNGANPENVEIWDMAKRRRADLLRGHIAGIGSLAVSKDGAVAFSGSDDGNLKRWDLKTMTCTTTASAYGAPPETFDEIPLADVDAIALSPDGSTIATGTWDSVVRIRSARDLRLRKELRGHDVGGVTSVALLPNNAGVISAGDDHTIRIWDIDKGTERHVFRVPGNVEAETIAVSDDGRFLLAGTGSVAWIRGGDPGGDIVIWDLQNLEQVACFKGHSHQIKRVMFGRKPGEFISSSMDGTVKIWAMKTDEP